MFPAATRTSEQILAICSVRSSFSQRPN